MTQRERILIVDDEPQIARVLRTGLKSHGYDVRAASDGISALATFGEWAPNLVVTDLAMPNLDGLELCRSIRNLSQVPIIVLSVRGEEKTKVEALDAGADDYITKPFGIDELLARVRAALRRASMPSNQQAGMLSGNLQIDQGARKVNVRNNEVHLTPKEYDLLLYFVSHPGRVLTHRTLLGAVWGGDYTEQTEYLRVFVKNLRKKVEVDPSKPRYILTEPWIGYRFDPGK